MARNLRKVKNFQGKPYPVFVVPAQQKVSATYLLSGWTPPPSSQHIIRVVPASDVNRQKEALAEVTSLHVYALAAGKDSPADAAALFNADTAQAEALFPLSSVLSRDGASQDSPPEPLSTLRSVQSVQEAAALSSLRCCAAEAAPLRPPRRPAVEVPAVGVGVKPEAPKAESRAEPCPAFPEARPAVKAEPKTKASAKSKVASMFGAKEKINADAPKAQPAPASGAWPRAWTDEGVSRLHMAPPPLNALEQLLAAKRTAAQRIGDSSDEESDQEMEVRALSGDACDESASTPVVTLPFGQQEVPSQPAEEVMEEVPAPTTSTAKGPAAKKLKRVAKTFINDAGEEVTGANSFRTRGKTPCFESGALVTIFPWCLKKWWRIRRAWMKQLPRHRRQNRYVAANALPLVCSLYFRSTSRCFFPVQAARALSPPKPAAAGKGGGQRNIMSFFGKK